MHHLTLVSATENELRESLLEAINEGCSNILALRGDPPANEGKDKFEKIPNGFEYSFELVKLIRKIVGNKVGVGVAAFPEGHIESENLEIDAKHFVNKINSGADLGVTQLFFENSVYFEYIERLKIQGTAAPIIPGLLPVTDYNSLCNFCKKCGTNIPQSIHDKFKPLADNKEATVNAGIEWTVNQALELIKGGAPGIHFYCLNKVEPVKTIWQKILQKL
jgi:methylenetetrahydrofolate reductase (NADPH)